MAYCNKVILITRPLYIISRKATAAALRLNDDFRLFLLMKQRSGGLV
jgi:hypothetical protein